MQSNTFDLFVIPGALPPVIHLAQYDNARTFEASLKNADGSAYMPPEGMTATFEGTNRLGGQYQIECEVDGANVTFTPDGNATNQWGRTAATITLRDGDDQITALNIIVDVQRAGVTNEEAAENPGFTDRIAQAITEYGALLADNQAAKTAEMTSPVGVDSNGKLWVQGGGSGGGSVETVNDIAPDANGNVELSPSDIGAYQKPSGGIPTADLAATVQASLMLANEAYQLPASGIPEADLASAVQTSLGKADGSVQKSSQAVKTASMTQPVGIDSSGKLWVLPAGQGGGGAEVVTVTVSSFVASMSASEIAAEYDAGNIVQLDYGNGIVAPLVMLGQNVADFAVIATVDGVASVCVAEISGTAYQSAVVPLGGASSASSVTITDTAGYYTSGNVEGALAEIGAQLDGLEGTLYGLAEDLEDTL